MSDNGWMTTDIFYEWFVKFADQVEERPLLLIFDGHLTHVSIPVVEKAIEEDISIVKSPPHVTDKLQPRDVACFGPLKRQWERLLNEWTNQWGTQTPMKKGNFTNMLAEIWYQGLSPKNVKSGFRATGIFPLDRSKFPKGRFDARLVKRYDNWVKAGKPKELMEDLALSINTPTKAKPQNTDQTPVRPESNTNLATAAATPVLAEVGKCFCAVLGQMPSAEVAGFEWFPTWQLRPKQATSTPLGSSSTTPQLQSSGNKSFEEIVLDKMKGKVDKPPVKRRKVDCTTKIITDQEYLKKLKDHDDDIKEKEEKKRQRVEGRSKRGKANARKQIDFVNEVDARDDEEDEEEVVAEEVEERGDEERKEFEGCSSDEDGDYKQEEILEPSEKLIRIWKDLGPPKTEGDTTQCFNAAIYYATKKPSLYIGKAIRRFLVDDNGPVESFELDGLNPHVGTGTTLEAVPSHMPQDIHVFPAYNIISGPLRMIPLKVVHNL